MADKANEAGPALALTSTGGISTHMTLGLRVFVVIPCRTDQWTSNTPSRISVVELYDNTQDLL